MRKFTFLATLLLCFNVFAQQEVNSQWKNQINPIFNGLNKNFVPHEVLLDFAMEFTNVEAYNGTLTDSTFVNTRVLGNIYKTLFMGKVTPNTQHFPLIETIAEDWVTKRHTYNQLDKNTIILSGLYYTYSKLKEDALSTNKITVRRGKYYDKYSKKGVWQNPYETKQTIAFTPPISVYNKKNFDVILPQNLMYSNNANQIQSIQINFNDGNGFTTVVYDQALQPNYSTNGTYDWIFKTTLTNGTILYSQTKVKIDAVETSGNQARMSFANNIFIPGPADSPFPTYLNGAKLRIDYAPGSEGLIMRPFIIAEGFDASSLTTPEIEGGDSTLDPNFFNSLFTSGNLSDLLLDDDTQEYDIIYIDWLNGTADIKDNSEVLKNVLDFINQEKLNNGSTEPNVLLGQSMGGVIGRYALADMEADNETHDVRLFIAHDSPMQGANTPLSFQYFSRHALDEYVDAPILYGIGEVIVPTLISLTELLTLNNLSIPYASPLETLTIQDTPAAVQLNYSYVDIISNPTSAINEQWQSELDAIGYPTQSRNIAISNGNECAVDHGFEPRAPFLEVHDDHNPDFFGDLLHLVVTPLIGAIASEYELVILGVLPGSSKYFFDLELRANPSRFASNREVYWGKIRYEKKLLWLLPISHTITDRAKDAPSGDLPYDTYSGGFFDILDVLTTNDPNDIDLIDRLPANSLINQRYGFIPVVSSLDIKRNDGDVNPNDYLKKYAGGTTPEAALTSGFDNFRVDFAPGQVINNEHISFQVRNGNWVAEELNGNNAVADDCSFVCDDGDAISGSSVLCTNGIYSVSDAATSVEWTLVPANAGTINELNIAATIVEITIANSFNGFVTLNAIIDSDRCGNNIPVTKTIHFGRPSTSGSVLTGNGGGSLNPGPTDAIVFSISTQNINAWTHINWTVFSYSTPNASQYFSIQTQGNGITAIVSADEDTPPGNYIAQARVTNNCGFLPFDINFTVEDSGPPVISRMSNSYVVYPNPSKNIVNITLIPNDKEQTKENINVSGELFDVLGKPKMTINMQRNGAQFDVSTLNPGVYVLKIYLYDRVESHQIVVK